MSANPKFVALRAQYPAAALHTEGGQPVVYLPETTFRAGGKTLTMGLLLHPSAHSGYVSRLFFEQKIEGRGNNWNQHQLIGRMWWTPSYQGVSPDQDWLPMLFAHLRAVE